MSLPVELYGSHDYKFLLQRWRKLCKEAGLNMRQIAQINGYSNYEVVSPLTGHCPTFYLSAGIHGDETGATEGLLKWAKLNAHWLHKAPLLIYPCLNPWGLERNSRLDACGNDLNRAWEKPENPLIRHVIKRTNDLKLQFVITLHEDFDGQGVYLYEPSVGGRRNGKAEEIVNAARPFISPDPRGMIDGRKARHGIIRPRPTNPPDDGMPEALYFYLKHKCSTFTFETPSEFALGLRIEAQVAMIGEAIDI
jgi:hypothetical protein